MCREDIRKFWAGKWQILTSVLKLNSLQRGKSRRGMEMRRLLQLYGARPRRWGIWSDAWESDTSVISWSILKVEEPDVQKYWMWNVSEIQVPPRFCLFPFTWPNSMRMLFQGLILLFFSEGWSFSSWQMVFLICMVQGLFIAHLPTGVTDLVSDLHNCLSLVQF